MATGRTTVNGMAPPGPEPSIACLGRPRPRSNKSRIAANLKPSFSLKRAICSRVAMCSSSRTRQRSRNEMSLSDILSCPLDAPPSERWPYSLQARLESSSYAAVDAEERELAHLNLYRLDQ